MKGAGVSLNTRMPPGHRPTRLDGRRCTYNCKSLRVTAPQPQAVGFSKILTSYGQEAQFHDECPPAGSPLLACCDTRGPASGLWSRRRGVPRGAGR